MIYCAVMSGMPSTSCKRKHIVELVIGVYYLFFWCEAHNVWHLTFTIPVVSFIARGGLFVGFTFLGPCVCPGEIVKVTTWLPTMSDLMQVSFACICDYVGCVRMLRHIRRQSKYIA